LMGTVVNTASILQYHFIHYPALYVKKRLKDLRRPIIGGPIRWTVLKIRMQRIDPAGECFSDDGAGHLF
jgi:hypothetical protein